MREPHEEISAERLIEAADAVIVAVSEQVQAHGVSPYPPDMLGSADQPEALLQFTRVEVEEATAFLVRLGVLQARTAEF